jgi:hypothetical protein
VRVRKLAPGARKARVLLGPAVQLLFNHQARDYFAQAMATKASRAMQR